MDPEREQAFRDIERAVEVAPNTAYVGYVTFNRQRDGSATGLSIAVVPGDGTPVTLSEFDNFEADLDRILKIHDAARARGLYLSNAYGPDGDR